MSDDVIMDEALADSALNTVISLLQQVATLLQQAVDALRALTQ